MPELTANPEQSAPDNAGQTPPAQDGETMEQLRARLGGLNKAYNTKQAEWQTKFERQQNVIADLTTKTKDHEVQAADLAKQLEAISNEKGTFETQAKELGSKAATYEAKIQRMGLFMLPPDQGGYSDLAHLEAKGLLKDGLSGEDLTTYLNTYRETLGTATKAAVQETIKGGVPPASQGKKDGEVDVNLLEGQMKAAMDKGDWATFEQLNTQWVKLKTSK